MSSYRSNAATVLARLTAAADAGLVAAGEVLKTEVKQQLAPGYASGAFVTGHVLGSVTATAPESSGRFRVVHVGTNVDYAMFWELGHRNLFMRRFAQKQVWGPAIASTLDRQQQAFRAAFAAQLGSDLAARVSASTTPVSEAAD